MSSTASRQRAPCSTASGAAFGPKEVELFPFTGLDELNRPGLDQLDRRASDSRSR